MIVDQAKNGIFTIEFVAFLQFCSVTNFNSHCRNRHTWNLGSEFRTMTNNCPVANSSSIYCQHGCCGTSCCTYELSETVIIVACVVGALVVVAVVVGLIACINGKQKNRVTRIRPRQRMQFDETEIRPRRVDIPKPPPYSEAPPAYDANWLSETSNSYSVGNAYPGATDSYYNSTTRSNSTRNPRGSPHPSTSGSRRNVSVINNRETELPITVDSRGLANERQTRRENRDNIQNHDSNDPVHGNGSTPTRIPRPTTSTTHAQAHVHRREDRQDLLPGETITSESPVPTNPSVAVRSAQRRAALQKLQMRTINAQIGASPPAYEI